MGYKGTRGTEDHTGKNYLPHINMPRMGWFIINMWYCPCTVNQWTFIVQNLKSGGMLKWTWDLIAKGWLKLKSWDRWLKAKENRIYIRVKFKNPSLWILSVPFSLKGSSKCTNHVNVHKLYAVEYIKTVCSLDYPFQFRIFQAVK